MASSAAPAGAGAAGRAGGARPSAVVPGLQGVGAGGDGRDGAAGIEQVGVLAAVRGPVQVLAPQPQPQVTGEDPGTVAEPGRVGGARSSRLSSSTAQDSSLSWVQERRLKLSLPTLAQTSSTTQTLACT